MKIKTEYLDYKIRFHGKDWTVRFIEKGLYPKMKKDGFAYMFENENKLNKDGSKEPTFKFDTE